MLVPYFCNQDNWDKLKEELLSWQGTPYRHFQRAKGYGADCTMFIGQAYINVGILKKLDYEYYSKDWHITTNDPIVEDSIRDNFNNNLNIPNISFKKVLNSFDDFIRGDVLLIGTVKNSLSNHSSVFWDDGKRMIHSINHAGVELTHYVGWWRRRTRYKIRLFQEI